MKKLSTLMMALFLVAACFCQAQAEEVTVLISPDTLVIEEPDQQFTLTVHAEIRYSLVDTSTDPVTVMLDGIPAKSTFPDNRGELVAKFTVGTGDLPAEGRVTLILTGNLVAGGTFEGSDEIWIVNKLDDEPGGPDGKEQNRDGNREGAQSQD